MSDFPIKNPNQIQAEFDDWNLKQAAGVEDYDEPRVSVTTHEIFIDGLLTREQLEKLVELIAAQDG